MKSEEDNLTTDEEREMYNAEAHLPELQKNCMDNVMVRVTRDKKGNDSEPTTIPGPKSSNSKKKRVSVTGNVEHQPELKHQLRENQGTPAAKMIKEVIKEAQIKQAPKVNSRRIKL